MNKLYLTITPFFPTPTSFRGPFVYDQVKAIERNSDYKVLVLKPKPWFSGEKDYNYEGTAVYRFRTFELPSNILPGLFAILSIWSLNYKLKKLNINPNTIAIAHAHVTGLGVFANALKKRNPKIQTLLQHHGFDVLSLENGQLRKVKWHRLWVKNYGKKISNKVDLHIGVSTKTVAQFKNYPEINLKKTYTLYNGVDTGKFYPIPNLKNNNHFVIGCVANFWTLKDQITLIKSIEEIIKEKHIKNCLLKLVGTGATRSMCEEYVKKNDLNDCVEFIDQIPHHELNVFYNQLHLFVLPSFYEAFGCVYTEAHACGVPFIAVENQGISELIPQNQQSNWLIKKQDIKQLTSNILYFYKNQTSQILTINYDINFTISNFLKNINNTTNG